MTTIRRFTANLKLIFYNAGMTSILEQTDKTTDKISIILDCYPTGEYPDYRIDFSKVVVSKGDLPVPLNASVTLSGNLLTFKWDIEPQTGSTRNEDQVMLLAYLPDTKNAASIVGGPGRSVGEAVLKIFPQTGDGTANGKDTAVETYIAFISKGREQVSDSVYLRRIEL